MRRLAAYSATLAVLGFTVLLLGWMLARVAEHPGVPRETGALPSWFAGAPAASSAHPRDAVAAVATAKPGTSLAQGRAGAAEGDYQDFANGEIGIALKEYQFVPSRIRTRPGAVVFVLRNEGRFAHDFHVEGPGVEVYAEKFSPGRTVRVRAVLQEGEYKVSCPLSNHDERGMHGKLIATSKLAGG